MWVSKRDMDTLRARIHTLEDQMTDIHFNAYVTHPQDVSVSPNYKKMYFQEFYYHVFLPVLKKLGLELVNKPSTLEINSNAVERSAS